MKKHFALLASALLIATLFSACDDESGTGLKASGRLAVNGRLVALNTGFYTLPNDPMNRISLAFIPENAAKSPHDEPEIYLMLTLPVSHLNREIDLSQKLPQPAEVEILAWIHDAGAEIYQDQNGVAVYTDLSDDLTVLSGTCTATFTAPFATVRFSARLSDGTELSGTWDGRVKQTTETSTPELL